MIQRTDYQQLVLVAPGTSCATSVWDVDTDNCARSTSPLPSRQDVQIFENEYEEHDRSDGEYYGNHTIEKHKGELYLTAQI